MISRNITIIIAALLLGVIGWYGYTRWQKGGFGSRAFAGKTCKCYCSDLCGPRDNTKPGDAPFIDEETGICFCQMRDKNNFVKNGCDKKENKPFESCCD